MAQREREEEAAREAHRAAMRAEMAEANRLQLQLKVRCHCSCRTKCSEVAAYLAGQPWPVFGRRNLHVSQLTA